MNNADLAALILAPHISEKSTRLADRHRQIVFKVRTDATKKQIRQAVSAMFDVEVESVRTVRIKGKQKAFGRRMGRRNHIKKAYVTLKEGQDLDFLGMQQ